MRPIGWAFRDSIAETGCVAGAERQHHSLQEVARAEGVALIGD